MRLQTEMTNPAYSTFKNVLCFGSNFNQIKELCLTLFLLKFTPHVSNIKFPNALLNEMIVEFVNIYSI